MLSIEPGKRLKKMDEEMLKQFDDEEIQQVIDKRAPGGIKLGKKSDVVVDASYAKTVPYMHGLESGLRKLQDDSPESETKKLKFYHVDSRGKKHELYVNVGVNITRKTEERFKSLCQKYSELFYEDENFFPYLLDKDGKPFIHRLNLREDAVIKSNPIALKLPPDHQDALSKAIKTKLRNNTFVRLPRTEQSYCNPLSVVPKSTFDENGNRKWRLVQSLVNISQNSLFINFKLDCPRELLEKIPSDAKFYHFFDSVSSFDSLKLHKDDIKYTGFMAPDPETNGKTFDVFGCSRVPQGHLNGSPNLVKTYNEIYKDCIQELGLAIYCDDFTVGQNSLDALLRATERIFAVSAQARVRFSPLKSYWFVMSGIFCGLQLKAGALTVPVKYASKVQDCQKPTNKSQLQRFLGLVNYTRSFIPDYSKHAEVLISVMNKLDDKGKMVWGKEQDVAFEMLKRNILNPLSLYSVDYHAKGSSLHLYFDSSKGSRAGCLFQKLVNEDGSLKKFRLIDYFSQTIPAAQKWSSILRNEWMALISCSEIWHRYLLIPSMEKFIYTDSKALWLMTRHRCRNPRIFEFINSLKSIYTPITFIWKKSEENFSDIFTRPDNFLMCEDGIKDKVLEIFSISSEFESLQKAVGDDLDKQKALEDIRSLSHKDYFTQNISGSKSLVAPITRSQAKQMATPEFQEAIADADSTDSEDEGIPQPGRIDKLKPIERPSKETLDLSRRRMFDEIALAMRQTTSTPLESAIRAHEALHIQRSKLIELFGITKDQAEKIIRNCENCDKHQSPNKHVNIKTRPYRKPLGPGVEGSMDVLHISQNRYYLGVRDNFSSFLRLQPITNLREETIYEALMKMYMYGGLPIVLKIDGASYFVGKHFKARMADRSVFLKTIAVANSNGNGVERLWRMVRDYLKRAGTQWNSVDTIVDMLSFINTVGQKVQHDGQVYSPHELQFGVKPYLERILQIEIPDRNYMPVQTKAVFVDIARDHNSKIPAIKEFDKFKEGMEVKYKRYGVKNPELLSGKIVTVDDETVTLKNRKGNLITRHFRDVII